MDWAGIAQCMSGASVEGRYGGTLVGTCCLGPLCSATIGVRQVVKGTAEPQRWCWLGVQSPADIYIKLELIYLCTAQE